MLQYLPLIVSGLQAASALSAANNVAKGAQQTPAERAQLQSMANQSRLLKAYLNPEDPVYQNIVAGENKQLNSHTQQVISNLLAANRKAQLMGRQTFFNPERQDESINQFMNKAIDTNANAARSNALQRILQAASGYGSNAGAYGNMIPNQQNAQTINNNRTPALLGAGANFLSQFGQGGSMSNIFSQMANNGAGA